MHDMKQGHLSHVRCPFTLNKCICDKNQIGPFGISLSPLSRLSISVYLKITHLLIMRQIYLLFFMVCSVLELTGQLNSDLLTSSSTGENWRVNEESDVSVTDFLASYHSFLGLGSSNNLEPGKSVMDERGLTHSRYQQMYHGIAVEGGTYLLHSEGSALRSGNGRLVRGLSGSGVASITESQALSTALSVIGAVRYAWEDSVLESRYRRWTDNSDASYYPVSSLVWHNREYDQKASHYRLAYRFEVVSAEPLGSHELYIDAQSGAVLTHHNHAAGVTITTTGWSTSYGYVSIVVDSALSSGTMISEYKLIDASTSTLIETLSEVDGEVVDGLTNPFISDTAGVDAHHFAAKMRDYLSDSLGRSSYDNEGGAIIMHVHAIFSGDKSIAYYIPNVGFFFGDGNSDEYSWTTVDNVGHEIAHAIIMSVVGLPLQGESGAIAEALCDMFGVTLEHYATGSTDYVIGKEIDGVGLRTMNDPHMSGRGPDPALYNGLHWRNVDCAPSNTNDRCGIHTNLGPADKVFYALAEGESGINEEGTIYNVPSIGIYRTMEIMYDALYYLEDHAGYHLFRKATIQAAADHGYEEAMIEAWNMVGLSDNNDSTLLTITYPLEGSGLTGSSIDTVTWITMGTVSSVQFQFSIDNGIHWITVADSLPNTGAYAWSIPDLASETVRLRIRSTEDISIFDQTGGNLTVHPCTVDIGFEIMDSTACAGDTLDIVNLTTGAISYEWRLNGVMVSTAADPTIVTNDSGPNRVTLKGMNTGCFKTESSDIEVGTPPDSTFGYIANGQEVQFFGPLNADSWYWDFGNGDTSATVSPTTVYDAPGLYSISCFAQTKCGIKHNNEVVNIDENESSGSCDNQDLYSNRDYVISLIKIDSVLYSGSLGGLELTDLSTLETSVVTPFNSQLPGVIVWDINVDLTERIWFATSGGIMVVSGDDTTIYNQNNSPLETNDVQQIEFDHSGNVWIRGNGGKLQRFDGVNWESFPLSYFGMPLTGGLRDLALDTNGNIWIGTGTQGLVFFDPVLDSFKVFNSSNSSLVENNINSLAINERNAVYIGYLYSGGYSRFDGSWIYWPIAGRVYDFAFHSDSTIWLAHQGGLWRWQEDPIFVIGNYDTTWGYTTVWSLHLSGDVAYAGTQNYGPWQVTSSNTSSIRTEGRLFDGGVGGIAVDNAGEVWATSGASGPTIGASFKTRGFSRVTGDFVKIAGATLGVYGAMGDIQIDTANNFSVVFQEAGLAEYSLVDSSWQWYNEANSDILSNIIYDTEIFDGDLWLATNSGLSCKAEDLWTNYLPMSDGLPTNTIKSISIDKNTGSVYCALENNGIAVLRDSLWHHYSMSNSNLPSNSIRELVVLESGKIAVATDNGLAVGFDSVYSIYNSSNSNLSSEDIYSIATSDGNIVAGLFPFDIVILEDSFRSLNSGFMKGSSQVPSNILINNNSIWVSTSNNLLVEFSEVSASISGPDTICASVPYTFTNSSLSEPLIWKVNGADQGSSTALNLNPSYSGTSLIQLEVENEGCRDVASKVVEVLPVVSFHAAIPDISVCDSAIDISAYLLTGLTYSYVSADTAYSTSEYEALIDSSQIVILEITDYCGIVDYDTFLVIVDTDCVYPGDFNKDGVVDHLDFFHWGQGYGNNGPERPKRSSDFVAQPSLEWPGDLLGVNLKHSDGDGNGFVDALDAYVIQQNWGLSHGSGISVSGSPSPVMLTTGVSGVAPGSRYLFYVSLVPQEQTTVTTYAVHVMVHFPNDKEYGRASFTEPDIDFNGSWLGEEDELFTDVRYFYDTDSLIDSMGITVTRFDHVDRVGIGPILTIGAVVNIDLPGGDSIDVVLEANGVTMGLSTGELSNVSAVGEVFSLTEPTCDQPTGLDYSISSGKVHFYCDPVPGADKYLIKALEGSTGQTRRKLLNGNTLSVTESALMDTVYYWTMQALCINEVISEVSLRDTLNTSGMSREGQIVESKHSITTDPNPSDGQFILQLKSPVSQSARLELVDMQGRAIFSEVMDLQEGVTIKALDLALTNGEYLLKVKYTDGYHKAVIILIN